jgi:hypothetical protein
MYCAAADKILIRQFFIRIKDTLILCTVLCEGQLKAVLGERRGSEIRGSDLTVLASMFVNSSSGL